MGSNGWILCVYKSYSCVIEEVAVRVIGHPMSASCARGYFQLLVNVSSGSFKDKINDIIHRTVSRRIFHLKSYSSYIQYDITIDCIVLLLPLRR